MKKFMNFIGEGVHENFLFEIRRVHSRRDFFAACTAYLDHSEPMTLMPDDLDTPVKGIVTHVSGK